MSVDSSEQDPHSSLDSPSLDVLPDVPDEGVLIKTLYSAICHSHAGSTSTPTSLVHIAGHEVCGKVMCLGGKVPDDCALRVGDVIVVYPWGGCGQCEICTAGSPHLCDERPADREQARDTVTDEAAATDNAAMTLPSRHQFAGYQVIRDWQHVIRLPRDIPPNIGCLLPCGALRAYTAMLEARPCWQDAVRVRGFANLLIVGGLDFTGLELWCLLLLKSVLCDRNVKVVCASRRRDCLDLALKAGADDAIDLPAESSVVQLVDAVTMSGYNRMDVAIDLVGDPTSFAVAVRALHHGGTVIELGAGWPEPVLAEPGGSSGTDWFLPLSELAARSVTLRAIRSGSVLLLRQLIDVLSIQQVTVAIPIEFYEPSHLDEAVDKLRRHVVNGRIVIRYN